MKLRQTVLVVCSLVLALHPAAGSQPLEIERVVVTDWGQVDDLRSAWADDAMGMHHSAPFRNSQILQLSATVNQGPTYVDQCTVKNDGYATLPSDPGRKLHHALLVGAFVHGKELRLVLKGCAYDRPRIIAVEVR
jgi:hypothetical protein